jgi:hypothetical protein
VCSNDRSLLALALALALSSAAGCKKTSVTKPEPGPPPAGKQATVHSHFCEIRATLTPERARFGMEIHAYVTFRATTDCDRKLTLGVGELGNSVGRPDTYRMEAVDSEGHEVRIKDVGEQYGGATSHSVFSREEPLIKRLVVSQWFTFPAPGRYEITVRKDLVIGELLDGGKLDTATQDWIPMVVSTFVDVEP